MHLSIKFQSDCLIEIYLCNYRFYSWLNRDSLLSLVELFNGASFSNLIEHINSLLILRNVCEIHLEKCWENCFCQISSSLYMNFKGFSIESFIVCFQSNDLVDFIILYKLWKALQVIDFNFKCYLTAPRHGLLP